MERVVFSPDKFKELMLYAAEQSVADELFGKVKLNKILFFSDFISFGMMGKPITGATYKKEKAGPVPTQLNWMARELANDGDALFVPRPYFNHTQMRLIAHRPANMNHFSVEEKDLIDDVISGLSEKNAAEVSLLSHERSHAWQIAEIGDTIPYSAVFLSARKATKEDIKRGRELARQYGWLTNAQ